MDKTTAEAFLAEVSDWKLIDNALKIQRNYAFDNFVGALAFTNRLGELSEAENHHPDIALGWGYCTVTFYTHKINGLHENDFIMAAKSSKIYQS
ncbi:MAG: 4a-hydroxytetrahydrobiopterin dehydratase [Gammaproteobacteria bacterium]|nr:4a-hydroxytetrahydrobiopterin dehydratase [Gammaproteobacteria bacterium]